MPQETLFNPNPAIQYPLENDDGMTVTGRVNEINTAVGRELGNQHDTPYLIDTDYRFNEGIDPSHLNKLIPIGEATGQEIIQNMPDGTVALLIRNLKGGFIPLYGVKIQIDDSGIAHFAVAGLVSSDGQHSEPAINLEQARAINIPPHLSPGSEKPDDYQNSSLVLGDAYHRATSLLGKAPEKKRGHNALDGQHNPGLHGLLVASIQSEGGEVENAGDILHGLHQLQYSDSTDKFDALRWRFHQLSTNRPIAPMSFLSFDTSTPHPNTRIAFTERLVMPNGGYLNIANVSPVSSVISEFITAGTAPPGDPDDALRSLDVSSGGLENIL